MNNQYNVPARYFLTHSVGCLPKTALGDLTTDFFTPWQTSGGNVWGPWLEKLEKFRGSIEAILGAPQSTICPQTNVSSALTKIIYSLPEQTGRKTILLSEQDFPTIGFVLKQAERIGFKLKFVGCDITNPQVWADAMSDDVAIVHITHALSNTSHLLPVKDICSAARVKDIISIVDIAQSVGIVPIHIPDWQPDFVIGTSVKFMCGGPGACFLYAAPEITSQCQPVDVGWFSHENPFEMDIHNFRYAKDAMRFMGGTPSPAPFVAALSAHKLLNRNGIENASTFVQKMLDGLIENLQDDSLVSPRDAEQRGGTLVIAPYERDELTATLTAKNIMFDERAEGFRFSVHHYIPEQDVAVLKMVLDKAL